MASTTSEWTPEQNKMIRNLSRPLRALGTKLRKARFAFRWEKVRDLNEAIDAILNTRAAYVAEQSITWE